MEYIVMDAYKNDEFPYEFDDIDDAIDWADNTWERMTDEDKKRCEAFYVIKSSNPDPESDEHYDGNIIKTYKDIYRPPVYIETMSAEIDSYPEYGWAETWTSKGIDDDGNEIVIRFFFDEDDITDDDGEHMDCDMYEWDDAYAEVYTVDCHDREILLTVCHGRDIQWCETYQEKHGSLPIRCY